MTRIPLDIVVTETGATTSDKVVAVMVSDLDEMEAQISSFSHRLVTVRTALGRIKHESSDEWAKGLAEEALKA